MSLVQAEERYVNKVNAENTIQTGFRVHSYRFWWRGEALVFTLYENFSCGQHEIKQIKGEPWNTACWMCWKKYPSVLFIEN